MQLRTFIQALTMLLLVSVEASANEKTRWVFQPAGAMAMAMSSVDRLTGGVSFFVVCEAGNKETRFGLINTFNGIQESQPTYSIAIDDKSSYTVGFVRDDITAAVSKNHFNLGDDSVATEIISELKSGKMLTVGTSSGDFSFNLRGSTQAINALDEWCNRRTSGSF